MEIAFHCPACDQKLKVPWARAEVPFLCPSCDAKVQSPPAVIGPGVTIDGFRLIRQIGGSESGKVFLADQQVMKREVALKVLTAGMTRDPVILKRFLKEAKLTAQLNHPHIMHVYGAGEEEGVYYLAMSYVEGETLLQRINRAGAMAEAETIELLRPIADALGRAWTERSLIHRDLKPEHIMINESDRAILMDFGFSKEVEDAEQLTLAGSIVGSPNYMSPELAKREENLDARSDIYAFGATLYHALTGQMPFGGLTPVQVLWKQATEALPDPRAYNPNISESCIRMMNAMLEKDREDRVGSWEEVLQGMDAILNPPAPAKTRAKVKPIKTSTAPVKKKSKAPAKKKTKTTAKKKAKAKPKQQASKAMKVKHGKSRRMVRVKKPR